MEEVKRLGKVRNRKIEQLAMVKSISTKVTANLEASPAGGNGDKVGASVERIIEREEEANEANNEYIKQVMYAGRMIERIMKEKYRDVLKLRYFGILDAETNLLKFPGWGETAELLRCTKRHAIRMKQRAIVVLDRIIEGEKLQKIENST